MAFDNLMVGDFVRFRHPPPDEPPKCVFEIVGVDRREDKGFIKFECVNDCGKHTVSTLIVQEYNAIAEAQGGGPFEQSLEAFANAYIGETEDAEEVYDLEEDIASILELL